MHLGLIFSVSQPASATLLRWRANTTRRPIRRTGRYNIPKRDPAYLPKLDRDKDGFACESKAQRPWLAEVPREAQGGNYSQTLPR